MPQYFNVKVQFVNEDNKKQSVNYLVDAMSVTEAEAKVADTNNPVGKIIIGGNKIGSTRSGATPINKIGGIRSGATPINKVGGTRSGATTQAQQNQNATSGRG